ncbi:MAG: hypothetical protein E7470_05750 [Ruminococcaceae bacterium]|nr:hypothetical protein [Oscillospiraceae bacterium]
MERDLVLFGIHIGEHSFEPDQIIAEIKERCIDCGHNFVTIRTPMGKAVPQQYFIQWAQYLADNKIYFLFLYTLQFPPSGMESHLTAETVAKMREIAGEYYIGDLLGEVGSNYACKWKHYYDDNKEGFIPVTDLPDMKACYDNYLTVMSRWIDIEKRYDVPSILCVEATALHKYNAASGVQIPVLELMCGHPEILTSVTRGVARATAAPMWGTYLAHEWYGGFRHEDMLKRKRMKVAMRYAYLAGSQLFCLESGDESIASFGYSFDKDHEICREYRDEWAAFSKFTREDVRPAGGPKTKVAIVQGNYDAWGSWGGSSVWNQFDRPEWGHGEAEHSWRLLEDVYTKRPWCDISNYGTQDLSNSPAYGIYDVIPAESSAETYQKYDYVIFLGWNTMTDEIYDNLVAYVENGGKLLMTAAHLNYSPRRDAEKCYPTNEKLERLFGCRFTGEANFTNAGVKFRADSLSGLLYPGTKNMHTDPIYASGYLTWLGTELTGGCDVGVTAEDFENDAVGMTAVIENKLGKGVAILVATANYPGHPALSPLYRAIMGEMLTHSARCCDIKVLSSDALRYAVYENGKMYLLNTDFDMPIFVRILHGGATHELTLQPMELKTFQL